MWTDYPKQMLRKRVEHDLIMEKIEMRDNLTARELRESEMLAEVYEQITDDRKVQAEIEEDIDALYYATVWVSGAMLLGGALFWIFA